MQSPSRREQALKPVATMEDYLYKAVIQLMDHLFPAMQPSLVDTKPASEQPVTIYLIIYVKLMGILQKQLRLLAD